MTEVFQAFVPRKIELDDEAKTLIPAEDAANSAPQFSDPDIQRWLPPVLDGSFVPQTHQTVFVAQSGQQAPAATPEHDFESLKEQAYQEAFAQGLAEGEAQAKAILAEQCQRLQMAMTALREPQSVIDAQLQEELLQMTVALAKQLLRAELSIQPERLKSMIEKSIKQLPVLNKECQIYLNPNDLEVMNEVCAGSESEAAQKPDGWQFIADASLGQGGYRIHSGDSTLDDSIETRLAGLLDSLMNEDQ
ncbi:hypothetical protein IB286_05370 [Spongiibacter sp. KMU-158]|uniref:Flagellar assembly protein FliH n=1 Tax=Spongiibacter pelagi TaxID=2760804 RepID=A0A927BZG3_9GAMM|nr:FliH/SctL family protein [Spongiibacter pelagi]MBD2858434.1 hypothetical protein [Spongiibacter pelagi]